MDYCENCECKLCYFNESCGYCNDCYKGNNQNVFCDQPDLKETINIIVDERKESEVEIK